MCECVCMEEREIERETGGQRRGVESCFFFFCVCSICGETRRLQNKSLKKKLEINRQADQRNKQQ